MHATKKPQSPETSDLVICNLETLWRSTVPPEGLSEIVLTTQGASACMSLSGVFCLHRFLQDGASNSTEGGAAGRPSYGSCIYCWPLRVTDMARYRRFFMSGATNLGRTISRAAKCGSRASTLYQHTHTHIPSKRSCMMHNRDHKIRIKFHHKVADLGALDWGHAVIPRIQSSGRGAGCHCCRPHDGSWVSCNFFCLVVSSFLLWVATSLSHTT